MIYRRGYWRVRTDRLYRFPTKKEAEAFLGEYNGNTNRRSSDGGSSSARLSETTEAHAGSGPLSGDEPSSGDASDLSGLDGLDSSASEHSDDESSDPPDRQL